MTVYAVLNQDQRVSDLVSEETPEFSTYTSDSLVALSPELHAEIWRQGNNGDWRLVDGAIVFDPVALPEPAPPVTPASGELPQSVL